jgi:hypothetical protein
VKDFARFLPHALIIAVLAGLMQLLDMVTATATHKYFLAWAGFAAWACYFVAGATPKGGAKVIGCWVAGVIASVIIIELGVWLSGAIGSATAGFPIAVGLIAFCVILFEKVPALDFIPAWFVGAACFFAFQGQVGDYKQSVPTILTCAVVGQIFGYATVLFRGKYSAMIAPPEAAKS